MKRILLASLVVALLVGAFAISGNQKGTKPELQIDVEGRNPWTHLRLNDAPEKFHFVVVSDRTGGNRGRIFSQAVEQINLLQPAFVVSVGDLIQGYTKDPAALATQWKEFQSYTSRLQMPFFYVPGNHDVTNSVQAGIWKERFGRPYYHFMYKDVLFLAVNSDDPFEEKQSRFSKEQIEYFRKVLADNPNPRWIFVCMHKPAWTEPTLETSGWLDIEKALKGRNYTVFAGHIHRYQKFVRQGMSYYQLATTGGGSKLRGLRYGEFDHIGWITVRKEADPIVANIMLDGIYPESLKRVVTDEEGVPIYNRKPTYATRGKVTFEGVPAANAQLIFWRPDTADKKGEKYIRVTDAFVEADGAYSLSTYVNNDGMQEGDYKVTVTMREPFFESSGKLGQNTYPDRYATYQMTPLTAKVKTVSNTIDFELTK